MKRSLLASTENGELGRATSTAQAASLTTWVATFPDAVARRPDDYGLTSSGLAMRR